ETIPQVRTDILGDVNEIFGDWSTPRSVGLSTADWKSGRVRLLSSDHVMESRVLPWQAEREAMSGSPWFCAAWSLAGIQQRPLSGELPDQSATAHRSIENQADHAGGNHSARVAETRHLQRLEWRRIFCSCAESVRVGQNSQ